MQVERTDRGFEIIRFADLNGKSCSLQASSAILDYPDSIEKPGSSAVWLGVQDERMHLNQEIAKELINHLQSWLNTGSF